MGKAPSAAATRATHPKMCIRDSFWRDLEDIPATEVFSVTRTGFSGLARPATVVTGNLEAIRHALGDIDTVGDVNGLRSMNKRRKALMEELLLSLIHI